MPDIPMVQVRQQAPRMQLPQIREPGPGAYVAKGLERLGIDLGAYAESQRRYKDGDDALKGTQALTDFALKIEEADEFARENSEPENQLAVWQERIKPARTEVEGLIKRFGNTEKANEFQQSLVRVVGTAERAVFKDSRARRLDKQVAEGSIAIDRLVDYATRSQSQEIRNTLMEQAGKVASELTASGAIKEAEGAKWMARANDKIQAGRAGFFITGLNEELDNLQNEAIRTPANAENLSVRGARKIREAGADWLPPEKVEEKVSEFRNTLWVGALKTQINENPKRAKAELQSGVHDQRLSQQGLLALNTEADTEIERRQRKAEAARKEAERLVGKEVDDFKTAVMSGSPWAGNVGRLQAHVKGTEHEREFQETVRDSSELHLFGLMGPLQQEQYLRAKAQSPKSGSEATLYGKLQTAHERTKTELNRDPISYAIRQGAISDLGPLDLSNPSSLKARSIAAGIVSQRYGIEASPLSDDEANTLSAQLERSSADQQAAMFRTMRQGLEDNQIRAVAGQLAKKKDDPVMAHAMGLSLEAPEAASRILRGREILKDNREVGLKGADLKTAQDKIASTIGEAFKNNSEHYSAVSDAALSIYAFKSWQQRDLSGTIDTKRLSEAIKEASGGVITLGSFGSRYTVQAPRYGMNEAGFTDLLKRADYSKAKGMSAAQIQQHGIFESAGDGKYMVFIGPGPVLDDSGKPFILDLGRVPARGLSGAALGGAAGMVR